MKLSHDLPIVVTGAFGCIGSCCVRYLNDLGITNLFLVDDLKKTDKWKNLLNKKSLGIISKKELFHWLQGKEDKIGAFIHLGACSDTMETDGDYLMENNFLYSVRLAKYATDNGIRFIYASSAATYGDGNLGFVDEHTGLDRLKPLNLYGFSKYYFDVWLKQHNLLDRVVGLKYFNVYGPNEDHKGRMASMVYKMFPVAYQKQAIRLFKSGDPISFADGEQKRDFIYVKDAVRMTCDFLENSLTGIFNIGSGMATSWNTLATALFKALGADAQIEYIDMPQSLAAQYQNYTCADMSKYKKALHTQKTTLYSIEEGVADYVQEHLLKDERW